MVMNKVSKKHVQGLTLIELIVTVAIAATLMAFATPYWSTMQKRSTTGMESRSIVTAFNFARSEAVTKKQDVKVVPTDGADWANGITVWTDDNGNNLMDNNEDEVLQLYDALDNSSVTPSVPVLDVTYDRHGAMIVPTSSVTFTLQLNNCDSRIDGRIITLNSNGRLELVTTPCA